MNGKQESSYDEVPYKSHPYPNTHPRNLEALAALFGMQPPPLPGCRVLELGCASGGNLIPLADELPETQLLGIDLSSRQVRDGQSMIADLELSNIELRTADINEIDDSWGQFDYIVCHGVYSWVPSQVQDKILEVCRGNLVPNGVAIISYNTHPGWYLRAAVRDMMLYHVSEIEDARQRIVQAQAMLDLAVEGCDENEPYGQLLKQELKRVRAVDDSYLYHEHLEDYNEPTHFYEFIERAQQAGLQYLSESNVSRMLTIDLPPHVQDALRDAPIIRREQYLDFIRNVGFRSTLLCHREIDLDREVPDERIGRSSVQLSFKPKSLEVDFHSNDPVQFDIAGNKVTMAAPLAKAALVHLGHTWPEAIAVTELRARGLEMLGQPAGTTDPNHSIDVLNYMLRIVLQANLLEVYLHPPKCVSTISDRPAASRLARYQAPRQTYITSRWHRTVKLDTLGRFVLERLDGQHDRAALEAELHDALQRGLITVKQEGDQANHSAEQITAMVDWALHACASASLLIA
jgi:methyltransferase-like protein/ubiquinone/menaquinone biosynthesis C-methylase UbiE